MVNVDLYSAIITKVSNALTDGPSEPRIRWGSGITAKALKLLYILDLRFVLFLYKTAV